MKLETFLDSVQGLYEQAPPEDVARRHIAALAEAAKRGQVLPLESVRSPRKRRALMLLAASLAIMVAAFASLAYAGVISVPNPFRSMVRMHMPSSPAEDSFTFVRTPGLGNTSQPHRAGPNGAGARNGTSMFGQDQNGSGDHGHHRGDHPEHRGDTTHKNPHGDSPDNPGGDNCTLPGGDVQKCIPSPTHT